MRRLVVIVLMLWSLSPLVLAQETSYEIPPVPEDVDLTQVVAQVGDVDITLADFAQRVRYERFRLYERVLDLVDDQGEDILVLEGETNIYRQSVQSVVNNLAARFEFGEAVYENMIREALVRQEAEARDIEPTECEIDTAWARFALLPDVEDCEVPDGFEAARTAHIEAAQTYTGMSEDAIQAAVLGQAMVQPVLAHVGAEFTVPDDVVMRTRHIRVVDEATANEVMARLEQGDAFEDLMVEYTIDQGLEGNAGELGTFTRDQMVAEFAEAAFTAEVGEFVGPVQTDFGFHILQVTDIPQVLQARHILFDNEEDAQTAVRLLNDGADFAQLAREYSLDTGSGMRGGELQPFGRGQMVPEFEEAAFNAEIGEIVGPVETQFGWHVIEVTGMSDEPVEVTARHILVETEDEAQTVLERLEAGEDFAALAREVSVDPSAAGHGGDTYAVITGGQERGFYAEPDVAQVIPEFDQVFDREVGEVVEPFATQYGYFIVEILEMDTQPIPEVRAQRLRSQYANEWEDAQLESGRVMRTAAWRDYIPDDPGLADVSEMLSVLEPALEAAQEAYLAEREANKIPDVLRELGGE